MAVPQAISSGSLNLVVQHRDQRYRTPVAPGVTIGRSPECTISIDDPDLAWIHSRIYGDDPDSDPPRLVSQHMPPSSQAQPSPFEPGESILVPGVTIALTDNVRVWCAREVESELDDSVSQQPHFDEQGDGDAPAPCPLGEPAVPGLKLTLIHDGQGRVVEVRDGLTIGRSLKCSVPIDDPDLCRVHARVVVDSTRAKPPRIVSEHEGFALVLPSGRDCASVELTPGCEFKIGEHVRVKCELIEAVPKLARIAALYGRTGEHRDEQGCEPNGDSPPLRVSCPRCRQFLLHLSAEARFCPKCGLTLPECCPPWEFSIGDTKSPDPRESGSLLAWLLMRSGRESKDATPEMLASTPRPATLVAYVNSMFNLGMRFEDRHAAEHNLAQALRYYEKAARLGSDQAKMRLGVHSEAYAGSER